MFKKQSYPVFLISCLGTSVNAALPIYPAEIIGRELNIFGAGWAGHVGITTAPNIAQDAYQVIEVLKDVDPIIQTNLISTFKTITPYWGSRYGISDRGNNALRILREANFQKDLGCATYTIWADYMPSTGSYDGPKPHPTYCGHFRCDTFINYIFNWGSYTLPTYNPPGDITKPTIPKYVFNAFPLGNQDGPLSIEKSAASRAISSNMDISINSIDSSQLNTMSPEEFATIVDIPKNKITKEGINNLFKLITDETLDANKRTFLMDKFGFVATIDMIPSLVKFYFKLNENDELPIKKQLIASLQNIYQRYLMLEQYPNEKKFLINFYLKIINDNLFPVEKSIVIRSFISLSSTQEILLNLNGLITKIDEQENKLASQTSLKLKMELLNKSPLLEKIILSNIINQLENENSSELDEIFNQVIVYRLSKLGPNNLLQSTRAQIQIYLNSTEFKHSALTNSKTNNGITLFSAGAWLEATALTNSNSLKDAGKYIANYLKNKTIAEQKRYIIGLSNTKYMQEAFESEPVLQTFKKNNNMLYLNTVGIPEK